MLHSFDGTDGGISAANVVFGPTGALYSTTTEGGAHKQGVAFRLDPPGAGQSAWTETVLHSFTGGRDGGYLIGGLAFGAGGLVYGTAFEGGRQLCGGYARLWHGVRSGAVTAVSAPQRSPYAGAQGLPGRSKRDRM